MPLPLNARTVVAGTILLGWGLGIVAFARREMNRPMADRMAEMALRVAPGATYYAALRNGEHVGFSSTTVDTLQGTLQVAQYFVADGFGTAGRRRVTEQTVVRLSRGLSLREFTVADGRDSVPRRAHGWMLDDSTLAVTVSKGGAPPDTHRVRIPAGLVLRPMLSLAVALGAPLDVGTKQLVSTLDPEFGDVESTPVTIVAESTFVFPDSAVFDVQRARWLPLGADTVTGWRMVVGGRRSEEVWIDDLGRPILYGIGGLQLRRTAYELAFENWRAERPRPHGGEARPSASTSPRTVLHAAVRVPAAAPTRLRVRLTGIPLAGFDLTGWGQTLSGEILTIEPPRPRIMAPSYVLPPHEGIRRRLASDLASAPLIEVDAPAIQHLARALTEHERNPVTAVERILAWMRDSVTGAPSDQPDGALRLLRTRRGDADAHARLFVATARASGIPARTVLGLFSVGRQCYVHVWAEVFLNGWVPVDPLFAQFPATPSHVRFLVDGAGAIEDFARATERLHLDVLP
jgi:transglutaminase-like putative cysteine protease